jgi:aspartyl-tRNA(Asn)/glutamyl-tRNA(Gln) amidotransferase subunit B
MISSTQLKIGMEIHVELATRSKMFSRTANPAHSDFYDAPPNTLIDPTVAGLPGALPVMNAAAVEMSIRVGLALGCRIAERAKWDRKNYFYPDLPKGYQISQYDLPLCLDGGLEIPADTGMKRIGIIRAHLEEDTGKLVHELPGGHRYDGSLVDLNRAGTPLLEIVSQPDIQSADEAVTFAQELRNICCFLGVTKGVMQRGHLRFEPNVNVLIQTDDGREVATPIVEVKNLNSFRAIHAAIEFEHRRQVDAWEQDGLVAGPGSKRTRGWDDDRLETVLQREKEDVHDYRYFPDPDLVPVTISPQRRDELAAGIPELPIARRHRYQHELQLSASDAHAITEQRDLCHFFERCLDTGAAAEPCAKWLLNAGAKIAHERETAIDKIGITVDQLVDLITLRNDDTIGSSAADELFVLLCDSDQGAAVLAESNGLIQVRDTDALESWIDQAMAAEPTAAADFAAGKDAAAGRLLGAVMKISGGQADAKLVRASLFARRDA